MPNPQTPPKRPELTITVIHDEANGRSWWRAKSRNGETVCVSEVYGGVHHRRSALRAAKKMAGRLSCTNVVREHESLA